MDLVLFLMLKKFMNFIRRLEKICTVKFFIFAGLSGVRKSGKNAKFWLNIYYLMPARPKKTKNLM